MLKPILAAGMMTGAALSAFAFVAAAQTPLQLKSVDVDLPVGDRMFPGGSAADAINNNCLSCHSAGMVLTQPHLPRSEWQAEVDKMRDSYKAPVGDEDVPAIVDYLAKLNGGK
jgi:hypothetical protein